MKTLCDEQTQRRRHINPSPSNSNKLQSAALPKNKRAPPVSSSRRDSRIIATKSEARFHPHLRSCIGQTPRRQGRDQDSTPHSLKTPSLGANGRYHCWPSAMTKFLQNGKHVSCWTLGSPNKPNSMLAFPEKLGRSGPDVVAWLTLANRTTARSLSTALSTRRLRIAVPIDIHTVIQSAQVGQPIP